VAQTEQMLKFAGYTALVLTLFLIGMLGPTVGYMASDEGGPATMILLAVATGAAFATARAGYDTHRKV
jgi:hypothetical protein